MDTNVVEPFMVVHLWVIVDSVGKIDVVWDTTLVVLVTAMVVAMAMPRFHNFAFLKENEACTYATHLGGRTQKNAPGKADYRI